VVEQFPKMEGRQLVMVLAPKKVAPKAAVKSSPKAAPKSEGTKPAETPGKVAAADGATAQNAAAGDKK